MFTKKLASISMAALVASLCFGAPPAEAEGLLSLIFGQRAKPAREDAPIQRKVLKKQKTTKAKAKAVKPARVAGKAAKAAITIDSPTYYDYVPQTLVKADFTAIQGAAQPVGFSPGDDMSFQQALSGLQDFELYTEKAVADALIAHYSAKPAFLWVSGDEVNERAREAVRTLSEAASHGLTPADYSVSVPSAGSSLQTAVMRLDALMRFELTLSARVLRYVRDAREGRIDPNRISGYYDFPAKGVDLTASLANLSHMEDVRTYLESRHPQNPEYQALRVELGLLEDSAETRISVDPTLMLKPGGTSLELPKVLELIAQLDGEMPAEASAALLLFRDSLVYQADLVPVVKWAQEKGGLKPDGVIGPRTVRALAGTSRADKIARVQVALEQLRWHPADLGSPRVFINQPAYTATYLDGGREALSMRVVIGRTENQTSFFYDEIEQVDYNPYWGVPQSILVNEMLPRLRRDPGYLDRSGYEVINAKGKKIPSSSVSWGRYGAKIPFSVRQTPSEANALGELKILFPNKHAIYMHDTPSKNLFERDERAFSHGCVRLHDPRGMAAAVLGTSVTHIEQKLKEGHSSEKVAKKIPVYVAYFTAWPDSRGDVSYFADVYERDARLMEALRKTNASRAPTI